MIDEMKRKRTINRKRVIKDETEDVSCFCVPLEIRFEDFTFKSYGQELTRNIEIRVCPDCGEKHLDGRSVLQMESEIEAKVLSLANERFEVPKGYEYLKYNDEVDVLIISYSNTASVISKDDVDKGLVYDFDSEGKLTGIEVIDFYGKFAEEDK